MYLYSLVASLFKTHYIEIKVPESDISGSGLGSDRYLIPTNK